jgi:uncharacterized protein YyaL (SSP411 family)
MPQDQSIEATHNSSIAKKAAYSRAAQKRLSELESRLFGVKARIRSATIAGHVASIQQLEDAQRAVDANLLAVRAEFERMRKSGETAWSEHARDFDTAWENLSQSINRLVARYSEGQRNDH